MLGVFARMDQGAAVGVPTIQDEPALAGSVVRLDLLKAAQLYVPVQPAQLGMAIVLQHQSFHLLERCMHIFVSFTVHQICHAAAGPCCSTFPNSSI